MGEQITSDSGVTGKVRTVGRWAWAHRRKLAAAALVALPVLARYVPGFPSAEAVSILRAFLGT